MIGQYIQNYKIVSHLGEGGMGAVYRATDTVLGREVALKMLHTPLISQSQFLERFKKEARVLAQLLHPNIAVIYNFIEQSGQHYMVMEYVEGQNLDVLLRKFKPLTYEIVVPLFIQALEGLQHAHKKGIYHRDIKPSNLILTPDGTLKLMDFGIAKIAGEQRMTQVNRVVGTIEFMAPELIEGKDPSVASDIYAAGVTMYELLTGRLPFENNSDFNLMQDILKKKPSSIERLNTGIPKALSDVVMKALEKKPENRYTDARAFQQALINAFPHLREISPSLLAASFNATPATQIVEVITSQPTQLAGTVMMQATRAESTTRPVSFVQNVKQQFLLNKKRNMIIAGALLLLIIAATFTFTSKNGPVELTKSDSLTKPQIQPVDPINNNSQRDESNAVVVPVNNNPRNINTPVTPVNNDPSLPRERTINQPTQPKEKTKTIKEEPAAPKENDEKPAQAVSKTVIIKTRAVVKVKLSENLNAENLREGQQLRFTVVGPVEYDDEIIIRSGASVYGTITGVGKVLFDVDITSIETAGGQKINPGKIEIKGKKRDVENSREVYSFSLGRGVTIRL
jgi:serine/threonine-protein kinase